MRMRLPLFIIFALLILSILFTTFPPFTGLVSGVLHLCVGSDPILDPIGDQIGMARQQFTRQVTATYTGNGTLTFSDNTTLFNITAGGLISFTPTDDDVGTHSMRISVSESVCNLTDFEDIMFTIVEAAVCGNGVCEFSESCSNCPQDCGECPGGGGGGGGAAPPAPPEELPTLSFCFPSLVPGEITTLMIDEEGFGIQAIDIEVRNPLENVCITLAGFLEQPAEVTPLDGAFRFYEITATNLGERDVHSILVRFQVDHVWLSSNGINTSTTAFYKFTNTWNKLPTLILNEDQTYVYFAAAARSFSIFAIAGEPLREVAEPVCGNGICESGESIQTCPQDCRELAERECTPGELRCSGDNLQICNEGIFWDSIEVCEYGCSDNACNLVPVVPAPSADVNYRVYLIILVYVLLLFAVWKIFSGRKEWREWRHIEHKWGSRITPELGRARA
jgi:PGF-pre-PGF domain-containing protein